MNSTLGKRTAHDLTVFEQNHELPYHEYVFRTYGRSVHPKLVQLELELEDDVLSVADVYVESEPDDVVSEVSSISMFSHSSSSSSSSSTSSTSTADYNAERIVIDLTGDDDIEEDTDEDTHVGDAYSVESLYASSESTLYFFDEDRLDNFSVHMSIFSEVNSIV